MSTGDMAAPADGALDSVFSVNTVRSSLAWTFSSGEKKKVGGECWGGKDAAAEVEKLLSGQRQVGGEARPQPSTSSASRRTSRMMPPPPHWTRTRTRRRTSRRRRAVGRVTPPLPWTERRRAARARGAEHGRAVGGDRGLPGEPRQGGAAERVGGDARSVPLRRGGGDRAIGGRRGVEDKAAIRLISTLASVLTASGGGNGTEGAVRYTISVRHVTGVLHRAMTFVADEFHVFLEDPLVAKIIHVAADPGSASANILLHLASLTSPQDEHELPAAASCQSP